MNTSQHKNVVHIPFVLTFFSSDKIFTLYEELQTSDAPAHLVSQYEDVISALMTDVKKMENETKKMEEKFARLVSRETFLRERD